MDGSMDGSIKWMCGTTVTDLFFFRRAGWLVGCPPDLSMCKKQNKKRTVSDACMALRIHSGFKTGNLKIYEKIARSYISYKEDEQNPQSGIRRCLRHRIAATSPPHAYFALARSCIFDILIFVFAVHGRHAQDFLFF